MKYLVFLLLASQVIHAVEEKGSWLGTRDVVKSTPAEENKKPAPMREISVIVTKEGYYPKSISVFEGERVRFYLTSTVEEPDCMIVEGHNVFLGANKGKISEAEVLFERPGQFNFYCPSSKKGGRVVVIKKFEPVRAVASDVWMPKEY